MAQQATVSLVCIVAMHGSTSSVLRGGAMIYPEVKLRNASLQHCGTWHRCAFYILLPDRDFPDVTGWLRTDDASRLFLLSFCSVSRGPILDCIGQLFRSVHLVATAGQLTTQTILMKKLCNQRPRADPRQ
ncbi:unnamed protein product [Soboliphyme baturini]|uniref:Secreted protein n=1 Tax=Soboliphyme baturini TaxID=241478 RepID=A0A183IES3_9BILA|nr:unnamed protein product [Soboliphyme baturini]